MYSEVNIMKFLTLILAVFSVGLGQEDPPNGDTNVAPINFLVVDGQNANISSYPYQVSLMYNGIHICGGVILSKYYVITPAHCTSSFLNVINRLSIRAGSSYQGKGGTIHLVSQITVHQNFSDDTLDYDISTVKLSSPIVYDLNKKSIQLALKLPYAGTIGYVAGWGQLDQMSSTAYQLQALEIPIVSRKKCISSYTEYITDRLFCAGYLEGGRGTCGADSGSGLVVDGKLIGFLTSGFGCALPNYPGIYTNMPILNNWIKSKVKFD